MKCTHTIHILLLVRNYQLRNWVCVIEILRHGNCQLQLVFTCSYTVFAYMHEYKLTLTCYTVCGNTYLRMYVYTIFIIYIQLHVDWWTINEFPLFLCMSQIFKALLLQCGHRITFCAHKINTIWISSSFELNFAVTEIKLNDGWWRTKTSRYSTRIFGLFGRWGKSICFKHIQSDEVFFGLVWMMEYHHKEKSYDFI